MLMTLIVTVLTGGCSCTWFRELN